MARDAKPDDAMALIAAAVRSSSGRSPLYRWMRSRHDEFAEVVEGARPNWAKLAEVFASLGMTGPEGKPLTPETVRHTWWRCRRDVAASRAKRKQAGSAPTQTPIPHVTPPAATMAPAAPRAESETDAEAAMADIRRELNKRSGRS